ncbi:MAG: squalene/phytoene synthase family protein [Verrucomicrobiales bacterium]|nr:squalene/phytoene synthase family protein [Verrucomicrobiales bacterium]
MKPATSETSQEIVSRSGSNLAFALAVLPPEKRRDMQVFYAFCRVIDDIADTPDIPILDRIMALDHWRNVISGEAENSGVESEFQEVVKKYDLSEVLLNDIIDGVSMDFEPLRFQTAQDLKQYCFKVASAVGLISIEIFGYRNPSTKIYAEELGYALQWTNIMRDVAEDAAESRIYLPLQDLDRFGIRESDLLDRKIPQRGFRKLMEQQGIVARAFYESSALALPIEDKPNLRSPELMRRIYFGILKKMENDNYRVFEKRYRLSKVRMLSEFFRAKFLSS